MKTNLIRWLMVLALAFYASGVAQFSHEVLEHSDHHPRMPRLVERVLCVAPGTPATPGTPGSKTAPSNHHHNHDDCPICQAIAAMHVATAHAAAVTLQFEPSLEIIFSPRLHQPAAPACDDSRLARPPPAA